MAALSLYPYQQEGVRFLVERPAELDHNPHRFLADEQGLGKTPQAIVAMKQLRAKSGVIFCPSPIKYNWARQMVAWGLCLLSDIFIVKTGDDIIPAACPFVVVNYELAIKPKIHKQLRARRWAVAVMDEAQRLKNMKSQRSLKIVGRWEGVLANCFYKFALSGTPIPNRPIEAYIILKTLAPQLIQPYVAYVAFGKRYCNGYYDNGEWNFKGGSNLQELHERLKPFMLRREIKDVYKELPPVVVETVYLDVALHEHPEVLEKCDDPYDPEAYLPGATLRRIVGECKVGPALEYLVDVLDSVPKLTIFAYHRHVIEELALALAHYEPCVLFGGVTAERKQRLVDEYVDNASRKVLIGQLTASGTGVDGLQKVCSNVVFVEMDWSWGDMSQALSRLQRIGQTETVIAKYLIATESIEMAMASVLERKGSIINQVIKAKRSNTMSDVLLERIAVALEKIADGGGFSGGSDGATSGKTTTAASSKAGSGKGAKAADKAPAKSKVTFDDFRDALSDFINGNKDVADIKQQAKAIIVETSDGKAENVKDFEKCGADAWEKAIDRIKEGPQTSDDSDDLDLD